MSAPLISTKLYIPTPPRLLVPRIRLTTLLDAGAQGKLILVSAPAGFGKTSLLAEWANHCIRECLVSWVHLDESDNELVRFLSYLIAALQTHQKYIGEVALSGLQSIPPAPIEAVLTSLINEIDSIERELILILDDYHLIDSASIHKAVSFLIEHLPAHMCLVIITRTDPPLPIHRLRARGQMVELRAEDLRFTRVESERYLEGILNSPISAEDIAALDSRIEGWIAGLKMAALSIQGKEDVHQFIESFSGSHRYIMDYLTEEIFYQQPPRIQKFLLQTSVLDRLSGPLCDYLLGADFSARDKPEELPSAQQILEYLERANLFLLPMDEERYWYRYHHLFASLLRQRLRQTWPAEIEGLQRRASAWCAANSYIDEAIKYALAAKDLQTAAQLVENNALEYLKRGALYTLLDWMNKLPEEIISGNPRLSVFFSWALLLTGNIENIERYLSAAEENLTIVEEQEELRGHLAAIRAYATLLRGEVEQAYDLANEALDLLPEDDLTVRCVVAFVLGGVNYMRRDIPGAIEAMTEAGRTGERAGNIHLAVAALSSAGDLLLRGGKLIEAEHIFERALRLGTGRSGRPLPIAANVYTGLAELHLARNDLKNARQFAKTGVELASQWGNMDSLAGSHLAVAHVSRLAGNSGEAQQALVEAKRLATTHNLSPGTTERIAAYEAMVHNKQPDEFIRELMIEPLSERELEVLMLIADGRSNAEIAAELIIALGTVKAHTSSIYRKLDARGRTEAVIKAHQLSLL